MMKIAIGGKGGVGKTLLTALLARVFTEVGYSVIAIDADPDGNLAATLGFPSPERIIPISEMSALIEERTGAKPGKSGGFFRLNPRVDDLPDEYSQKHLDIKLMVMGRLKKGGSGCYCPENALLRALVTHLLLGRDEVVILDMEAGIEHLGRATAKAVDKFIIVVEPGRRSVDSAYRVYGLARDIALENIAVVGNKIRNPADKEFLISNLTGFDFLGFIPHDQAIVAADMAGLSLLEASQPVKRAVKDIYQALLTAGVAEA